MRPLILLLLCLVATTASALPILFDSVQYSTTAFAELGDAFDAAADGASPPDALPVQSNAGLDGLDQYALADGIADEGLLATVVDVLGAGTHAGAVATADFIGTFNSRGRHRLSLDFESFGDRVGGVTDAQLAVTLTVGLDTLIDQILDRTLRLDYEFDLASALDGVLSLSLVSTADASDGTAFALSSVAFELNAIPEPSSLALTVLALGAVLAAGRATGLPSARDAR